MLGGLAYQSPDSVSVDTLEVTDKVTGNLTVNPGDLTITGDTSDAYTAGTLKLIAGNLGTNSIQLGDVSDADIGKIEYKNSDNSLRLTTNATEAVTVNSSQNVGIGADPGSTKMRISGGSGQLLKVDDGANALMVCDATGRVGINQSSMSSYNSNANTLVVGGASGNEGMTIASGASSEGGIYFANGTTGTDPYNGALLYRHNINRLDIFTNGAARWFVDSTGNLIAANAGQGIDFGSGASTTISSYETGTWTPSYSPLSGGYATMTMDVVSAVYCRVGDLVWASAYIRTDNVDTTGGSGGVSISGLPFTSESGNTFTPITIGYASGWVTAPNGGYVTPNTNYIRLAAKTAVTGDTSEGSIGASSFTSGANADKNLLIFSVSYRTT